MKIWLSNALGIACIGGAALGLTAISAMLFHSERSALETGILVFFALLYVWGAWCGVLAIRQEEQFLRHHLIFWALQLPAFSTSLLSYTFTVGALLITDVRFDPIGWGWQFFLGSKLEYSWGVPERPIFGINLLALGIWLLVWRSYKRTLPPPDTPELLATTEC